MNRRPIVLTILSLVAYLSLWVIVPRAGFLVHSRHPLVNLTSFAVMIALFIAVQVAIVRWTAEIKVKPYMSAFGIVLCLMAFAAMIFLVARPLVASPPPGMLQMMGGTLKQFRQLPEFAQYLAAFGAGAGAWSLLAAILVMASSVCVGYTLSFLLREKNILLPVSVFAAYTDFWTVFWGPTSQMVKKAPAVVQAVSAAIPQPGAGTVQPISFIGPGDFIFMAMFFAALSRLKMETSKTYWILVPLMTIGMLAVLMGVFPIGLPALILVAIAVTIANRKQFKLQKQEIIATVVVAVILVLSAVVAYPHLMHKR